MGEIVFLYHSWCPSEWVPPSHDPVNPLRGPRLKPKKGQKLSKCVFYFILMRLKAEIRISAGSPFSVLEMFFICVWRASNLKKKKPKKVHLQSDPDETKNKKTHQSQNATFILKISHTDIQRSQAQTQKWQNLKKFTLSHFDETENKRTHYSQNTIPPLQKFVIGI